LRWLESVNLARLLLTVTICLSAEAVLADLEVLALFRGAALLKVDGEQKLLKVGQTWKNVALLEASSREAVADIGGERVALTVSKRISSSYTVPETRRVLIRKNGQRQYITTAEINGRRAEVLVDTGANIVAINANAARAMGIDYERGAPSRVATAGGVVKAWSVILDSVDVGGIAVSSVQASVLEGAFPETVLLGMTYLQHVELSENGGVLSLTARY
jgi:aspartyl protease family protein